MGLTYLPKEEHGSFLVNPGVPSPNGVRTLKGLGVTDRQMSPQVLALLAMGLGVAGS